MQISFLNNTSAVTANYPNKQFQTPSVSGEKVSSDIEKETKGQKVYASNLSALGVNFKGKPDEQKTLADLKNEYTWYVNHDKTRPLDAFLKIKANKEAINELFADILSDENLSYGLIDDIAGRAREAKTNFKKLEDLLGYDSPNLYFYDSNALYSNAFGKYMDKKYREANSIESLLKFRPDWKEDALINKYEQLTGSRDLKFGNLPEEFSNGRFEKIYNYLQNYMQSGFKNPREIPPLNLDNRTYTFEYFTDGRSDKNVFGVYTPYKKYIFKIAPQERKSLNKPFSLGALALIDGYLTLNNCRNIAHLYYYDHNKNTSIYKYQEHNQVNQRCSDPSEVNYYMPDFQALGMCYNDTVGYNNYFLSDIECKSQTPGYYFGEQPKELISVDNDHVTYSSPFMLMTDKYNKPLPNAMQTAF